MTFAVLLRQYRQSNASNQAEVIEKLRSIDSSFEKLDETTYSRWENAKTTPSLIKQAKILINLSMKSELRQLVTNHYTHNKSTLEKTISNRFGLYKKADTPYKILLNKVNIEHHNCISSEYISFMEDFHKSVYSRNLTASKIELTKNNKSDIYYFNNMLGNTIGHFAVTQAKWSLLEPVIREEYELNHNINTINKDSKILYLLSDYSIHKDIFLYKHKIIADIVYNNDISYVIAKMYIGLPPLHEQYKFKVIASGQEDDMGVKHNLNKFQWIMCLIPAENIMTAVTATITREDIDLDIIITNK
ncbi:hypothetical protein JK628_20780 [Shewanella sp. KX20019]|uniref:helix-turn-helix domain-containing protein n=1 Tax=Shewanella sp. KX20019 TaxID=2803864 RepID=UPI001928B693|nr:hypothetical protein [Shewanella sp. KX20019]QQX79906.1 hypothetical protein JK628_20780 [Shewanella sp. KX20019]